METQEGFYAHSTLGEQKEWETILTHSNAVASKSSFFSKDFGFDELGEMAGLLHDIGKYQQSFQKKLKGVKCGVEHSNCGAKEVFNLLKVDKITPINAFNTSILAYIIAGHHSGLPDCGVESDSCFERTLFARLKRESEDYSFYKKELLIKNPTKFWIEKYSHFENDERIFAYSIVTRLLFSSLVDSDSLETEKFYTGKDRVHNYSSFRILKEKLDKYIMQLSKTEKSRINEYRQEIQNACFEKSNSSNGLFSLTVPTGGGKTISSMVFAINHLIKRGQKRIIYVIPYTTIIEQTAQTFKNIFGGEHVLENFSNFTYEDQDDEDTSKFLATENWDAPIILTTNVQFFESLFSNKRGSCRKLHNIANSVIIFDEAQMLPISLLKPCLKTVDILSRNFDCTALLMSATCPNYLPYLCKDAQITELNENFKKHYKEFNRTQAQFIGIKSDEEIIKLVDKSSQTLVIVNFRKHAESLFNALPEDINKYHLSTKMFPKHRKEVIERIKTDLKNGKPCVVVSTQLIECGVDLDFACVFRSLAGIDSIVQAGGRCNREGKRQNSKVYIFESPTDLKNGDLAIFKNLSRDICENPQENDLFQFSNIDEYFSRLLNYKDKQTDEHNILKMFSVGPRPLYLHFDFQKCNDEFHYIEDSNKVNIIVPIDEEARLLITNIKNNTGNINLAFRKLNQYIVSIYQFEFLKLKENYKLTPLNDKEGLYVLLDDKLYDENTGLFLTTDKENNKIIIV